jgi:hypothetical protein
VPRKYTDDEYREIRNARKRQKRLEQGAIPRARHQTEEDRAAAREQQLAAKRKKYEDEMALLRQDATLYEQRRAAKRAALKVWREADRKKRGLPPPKIYTKYETDAERQAALRRQAAESRKRVRERKGLPPAKHPVRYASEPERRAVQNRRTAEWRNQERQRKAEAALAAREFVRNVPALIGSRTRTRMFISLCEYGPLNSRDLATYASHGGLTPTASMRVLVDLGIVGARKRSLHGMFTYYLNPGHPAHHELLAFGLALAARWPSPWRRPRKIEQRPIRLKPPADQPFPANLFAQDRASRTLLLAVVTGGIISQQAAADSRVASDWHMAANALRRYEEQGIVIQETARMRGRAGAPKGRFTLNPEFFAASELKNLIFALCATVYDDIPGIARALAKRDPRIAEHLAEYDRFVVERRP